MIFYQSFQEDLDSIVDILFCKMLPESILTPNPRNLTECTGMNESAAALI